MSVTVKKRKDMDMIHGPMMKNILLFALPLAASGLLQQLFTSADTAIVFWYNGNAEQAAVSSNGALINLLINLFTGLSVGVTVAISEYIGRNRTDDIHSIVFTSLVIAVVSGVFLLAVCIGVAAPLLELMSTPVEVLPLATQYLRIYFAGMPFFMVYNFGAAILRSVGDTMRPLVTLALTGLLNVGLNFLFVAALDMGVAGVAITTVISNAVSAAMVVVFLMKNPLLRIRFKQSKIRKEYLRRIFVVGVPAGLQGVVFSISNVFIQSSINSFGEEAMAGNGDAVNFESFVYFFVSAFATAAVSFISQNYAAKEYGRCRRAFWLCMGTALVISTVLGLSFTLGGRLFIRIYTSNEKAIEFALMRMWCVLTAAMLPCFYEVAGGALRGLGHSMLPAVFTVIGSCLFRLVWIYTAFVALHEFWLLVIVYPITWVLTGAAMLIAYFIIAKKAFVKSNVDGEVQAVGEGSVDPATIGAAAREVATTADETSAAAADEDAQKNNLS